jgi:hypothetical protein
MYRNRFNDGWGYFDDDGTPYDENKKDKLELLRNAVFEHMDSLMDDYSHDPREIDPRRDEEYTITDLLNFIDTYYTDDAEDFFDEWRDEARVIYNDAEIHNVDYYLFWTEELINEHEDEFLELRSENAFKQFASHIAEQKGKKDPVRHGNILGEFIWNHLQDTVQLMEEADNE